MVSWWHQGQEGNLGVGFSVFTSLCCAETSLPLCPSSSGLADLSPQPLLQCSLASLVRQHRSWLEDSVLLTLIDFDLNMVSPESSASGTERLPGDFPFYFHWIWKPCHISRPFNLSGGLNFVIQSDNPSPELFTEWKFDLHLSQITRMYIFALIWPESEYAIPA